MGWRGTIRAYQSAVRQAERNARKRQRELELQQKQFEKMQEFERAKYEIQVYENRIEVIQSLHKECGPTWDWKDINESLPPEKPIRLNKYETEAKAQLQNYKPGAMDKLFNKAQSKIEELSQVLQEAIKKDDFYFNKLQKEYDLDFAEWKKLQNLSSRILNNESEYYVDAIKLINPFNEIQNLGAKLSIEVINGMTYVLFAPNDETVIPSETKSLLASGKLSTKATSKTKLNLLYQDYLCSAVLRITREVFAILPINVLVITALKKLLNTQTGYLEEKPVLSVAIPRETLESLNFDLIDPSDSMNNFVHNMKFSQTNGFSEVEKVSIYN